jgi:HTH-type transcriptional regulator, sugar sensing transcriptional regulator
MELKEKLQKLGIPKREAEIYLALLQKKEFSAGEISKITSISRNKSYEILQNLVKKGLCSESYRNGTKVFSCIKPKIVMENIISDFEEKKNLAYELENNLTEMFEVSGANENPIDYIEVLTDKEQIRDRYMTFIKSTKKELLGFTKPPYAANFSESVNDETVSIKNKTTIKGIYEYKDLTPEEIDNLIKGIEAYQKIGEEARIIKELPFKLLISDETVTMFALNDRISLKPSITSIVIDHPNFANVLKEVFENYWVKSLTIKEFKKNKNKYLNSK